MPEKFVKWKVDNFLFLYRKATDNVIQCHKYQENGRFDQVGIEKRTYVQTLDLKSVGKSFGFVSPPHIDLGVGVSKKIAREGKKNNDRDHKKAKIYRQGKPKNLVQFAR